jgi:Protein of unknown function (DUF3499)
VNTRCCSRTACKKPPVYTLTYVYRDSTAVLGPLAVSVDPHSWDLCEMHAGRLVVPRGWDVVRLPADPAQERADDLEALANVVREVGSRSASAASRAAAQPRPGLDPRPAPARGAAAQPAAQPRPGVSEPVGQGVEVGRRGHLRVLRSAPSPAPDA